MDLGLKLDNSCLSCVASEYQKCYFYVPNIFTVKLLPPF